MNPHLCRYRYNPPGNYWGAFASNIFPRIGGNTDPNPPSPNQPPATPSPSPSPDLPQNPPPVDPSPSPAPPPPAGTPRNFQLGATMQAGWFISAESGCMSSTNKQYRVCITGAGNVTVMQVKPRKVVWASNTKVRKVADLPAMLWLSDDNVLSGKGLCCSVVYIPPKQGLHTHGLCTLHNGKACWSGS
jgi:hypothetical protein